jgi:hypothetical protein
LVKKFAAVLQSIGGTVYEVKQVDEMIILLQKQFDKQARMLTLIPSFSPYALLYDKNEDPHLLADVDVAIIKAHFAVAENGGCLGNRRPAPKPGIALYLPASCGSGGCGKYGCQHARSL